MEVDGGGHAVEETTAEVLTTDVKMVNRGLSEVPARILSHVSNLHEHISFYYAGELGVSDVGLTFKGNG